MRKTRTRTRWIAFLLLLAMVVGLLPTAAFAAEAGTSTPGTLKLDKTVDLADDGTYTINLEAYATGTLIPKSTDIVLVLDVSGSMTVPDYPTQNDPACYYYTSYVSDAYRLSQSGVKFYHDCYKNQSYNPNYPMTVSATTNSAKETTVTFTCPQCNGTIRGKYSDTTDSKFTKESYLCIYTSAVSRLSAVQSAAKAFVDAVAERNSNGANHQISIVTYSTDAAITQDLTSDQTVLTTAINNLTANGATRADLGLEKAKEALANSTADSKMVILLTDGVPTSGLNFENAVASAAVTAAEDLQSNYGAHIYSLSIMEDSRPEDDPTLSTTDATDRYLHAVSSNYPNAKVTDAETFTVDFGTRAAGDYYKKATEQDALTSIFSEIVDSVLDTVELGADAVLKDVLSSGFTFTDNTKVTVRTADYEGSNSWATPTTFAGAQVTVDKENNSVSVSGFSFKDHYVSEAPTGQKLVVTITGVEAKDEAITNGYVYTNDPASGIYKNSSAVEAVAYFPHPTVMLTSKTYVMDYAGSVNLNATDWQQSAVTHIDEEGMHQFSTANTNADMTYGYVEKVDNSSLTYTPQTMEWDGYDSFYVFGKKSGTDDENLWSKVSVLPANNVYYEDTFVTTEGEGSGAKVGIQYTGGWTETGESQNNPVTTVDTSGGFTSEFERVTSVGDITDGDYVLIVKVGDNGTYQGDYSYYALTNNALKNSWMQAMGADGYIGNSVPDSIVVNDESIIWSLRKSDDTFTLTDSTENTLYHSGNGLTLSDENATAWTAAAVESSGNFYLQDMADGGRYVVLRDDSSAGGTDDYGQPRFRCKKDRSGASDSCFEFILYRRKPANTQEVEVATTTYQLVTDAADITDGKYVLITQVGKGKKYSGDYDYFAIKKQEIDNTSWIKSEVADSYIGQAVPNVITVTDDNIIWVLDETNGTFTLTDGAGTALYHSGNNLRYRSGNTATQWTATKTGTDDSVVTFYLEASDVTDGAQGRYLGLRDDQDMDTDDLPRFRCTGNNSTASASCYQFYLYRQVIETTTVPVETDDSNSVHGWEDSYGGDSTFSSGTAHVSTEVSASATFTFTGTGVDIYSRTYEFSGRVCAQLKRKDGAAIGTNEDGEEIKTKNIIVDERAYSGDYYQIPTLSFSDLEYGTYQVKIAVMTNPVEGKDPVYYLDGIRVYNPLSTKTQNDDKTVKDAYGDELNATFQEVRDVLIDAGSFDGGSDTVNGAVFLDRTGEVPDGEGETGATATDEGTYTMADYVDYGPKNEVYLAQSQAVAFKVTTDDDNHYYIGLKAPDATKPAVKVYVSDGANKKELTIQGASDMYYEVVPSEDGYILIQNASDSETLLSITKLRITDPDNDDTQIQVGIQETSVVTLMAYADTFDSLPVSDTVTEPEPVEPETTEPEPTEPEPEEPGSGDVQIENPEPENPYPSHIPPQFLKMLEAFMENLGSWFPFPRRNP